MKELSIFIDESGDFGEYSKHSPFYIITMVFHDQRKDLSEEIIRLREEFINLGYEDDFVVHTGPLIRKEEIYYKLLPNDRRAIFTKLFFFTMKSEIKYRSFVYNKRKYDNSMELEARMTREIALFLRDNLAFFQEFNKVILYYDNGQKQITRILNSVFTDELSCYDIRRVMPKDYKLFQAADLICTLELMDAKCAYGELTKSEIAVFHSKRDLYKQFIRPLKSKRIFA